MRVRRCTYRINIYIDIEVWQGEWVEEALKATDILPER